MKTTQKKIQDCIAVSCARKMVGNSSPSNVRVQHPSHKAGRSKKPTQGFGSCLNSHITVPASME